MNRLRLLFLGLVVLAIIALSIYAYLTGQLPGMQPRPLGLPPTVDTPRAVRQAVGQTFRYGDVTYTVSSVERTKDFRRGRTTARPLGTFVVVSLTVRNNGPEPVTLEPHAFVLLDGQGRRYLPDADVMEMLRQNRDEVALVRTLSPGLAGQGILVFDLPEATGLTLRILRGYQDVGLE